MQEPQKDAQAGFMQPAPPQAYNRSAHGEPYHTGDGSDTVVQYMYVKVDKLSSDLQDGGHLEGANINIKGW